MRANEHARCWIARLVRRLSDATVRVLRLLRDAYAGKRIARFMNKMGGREAKPHRSLVCTFVIALLMVAVSVPAVAQQRRAVWVSAIEDNLGVNVVRDDGRVVSYWNVAGATGARIIPGLENIVATTARLALRRDGAVFTWQPKCDGHTSAPGDVENSFCEFPRARLIPGLSNIVALAENQGTYFALDRDGAVWGWGDDSDGLISGKRAVPRQLGKNFKRRIVKRLTRIPLPVPMASLASKGHAVDHDGYVWIWGDLGTFFGRATGNDSIGPNGFVARRIDGLPPIQSVEFSYALTRSGEVWRWGAWRPGRDDGSPMPTRIAGLADIVAISQNYNYVASLAKDGIVLFVGRAPDADEYLKFTEEPHATKLMPRAKFISGPARITIDGAVFLFNYNKAGAIQRLELGD